MSALVCVCVCECMFLPPGYKLSTVLEIFSYHFGIPPGVLVKIFCLCVLKLRLVLIGFFVF